MHHLHYSSHMSAPLCTPLVSQHPCSSPMIIIPNPCSSSSSSSSNSSSPHPLDQLLDIALPHDSAIFFDIHPHMGGPTMSDHTQYVDHHDPAAIPIHHPPSRAAAMHSASPPLCGAGDPDSMDLELLWPNGYVFHDPFISHANLMDTSNLIQSTPDHDGITITPMHHPALRHSQLLHNPSSPEHPQQAVYCQGGNQEVVVVVVEQELGVYHKPSILNWYYTADCNNIGTGMHCASPMESMGHQYYPSNPTHIDLHPRHQISHTYAHSHHSNSNAASAVWHGIAAGTPAAALQAQYSTAPATHIDLINKESASHEEKSSVVSVISSSAGNQGIPTSASRVQEWLPEAYTAEKVQVQAGENTASCHVAIAEATTENEYYILNVPNKYPCDNLSDTDPITYGDQYNGDNHSNFYSNKPAANYPMNTTASKNLMLERRRRKNLNERLYSLRALVPKISKMDKASIVSDAINYVQDLQKRVVDMQNDILSLQASKSMRDVGVEVEGQGVSSACSDGTSNVDGDARPISQSSDHQSLQEHKILKILVSAMEDNTFHLLINCKKERRVLVQVTRAMEALRFEIVNANLTTVNNHLLNSIVVKGRNNEVLKPEEVKKMVLDIAPRFGLYV